MQPCQRMFSLCHVFAQLHQNPGIKEFALHMKHYFKLAGLMLSEYFIVSPKNILNPIKHSCQAAHDRA